MMTILLVEDDQLNRDMLQTYLAREGYQVMTARNGSEGLALARSLKPDLILLDMGLPVLDGWALASKLRADPALVRVPLIALTAYAMPGDRERCLAAGCDDYCSKPIDFAVLKAQMRALLAREGS